MAEQDGPSPHKGHATPGGPLERPPPVIRVTCTDRLMRELVEAHGALLANRKRTKSTEPALPALEGLIVAVQSARMRVG